MLAACLSFRISDSHSSARPAVIAFFIFVFFFFYSWGQGPVAFAYSSEIFPLLNREQGMSFAGKHRPTSLIHTYHPSRNWLINSI
jgi:hypothetical protein